MQIDILNLKPTQVSTDPKSFSMLLYGLPKVGKTTFATTPKKTLLLGFEKGYSAIANIYAQPINSWAEFVQVCNQLKSLKRQEETAKRTGADFEIPFEHIVIDTADIAWEYCEKYVLTREGVDKVGDISYGAGFSMIGNEYDDKISSIVKAGYGLTIISHAAVATDPDDPNHKYITCSLAKRPKLIITRLVDTYGYAEIVETDDGIQRLLHTRATPEYEAGTRFADMPETIPFSYAAYEEAVKKAAASAAKRGGVEPVSAQINNYADTTPSFDSVKESIDEIITKLMDKDADNYNETISNIVSNRLGEGRKLSKATEDNIEQLLLILSDLREITVE